MLEALEIGRVREDREIVSRLNSAAPYNTQACPPINRARTSQFRKVERTLRIGFGVKSTSLGKILGP